MDQIESGRKVENVRPEEEFTFQTLGPDSESLPTAVSQYESESIRQFLLKLCPVTAMADEQSPVFEPEVSASNSDADLQKDMSEIEGVDSICVSAATSLESRSGTTQDNSGSLCYFSMQNLISGDRKRTRSGEFEELFPPKRLLTQASKTGSEMSNVLPAFHEPCERFPQFPHTYSQNTPNFAQGNLGNVWEHVPPEPFHEMHISNEQSSYANQRYNYENHHQNVEHNFNDNFNGSAQLHQRGCTEDGYFQNHFTDQSQGINLDGFHATDNTDLSDLVVTSEPTTHRDFINSYLSDESQQQQTQLNFTEPQSVFSNPEFPSCFPNPIPYPAQDFTTTHRSTFQNNEDIQHFNTSSRMVSLPCREDVINYDGRVTWPQQEYLLKEVSRSYASTNSNLISNPNQNADYTQAGNFFAAATVNENTTQHQNTPDYIPIPQIVELVTSSEEDEDDDVIIVSSSPAASIFANPLMGGNAKAMHDLRVQNINCREMDSLYSGMQKLKEYVSNIRLELLSHELWNKFHEIGTEMIITKAGRRMFPTLKINISGLHPHRKYIMAVDVLPLDNKRYRYAYTSSQWIAAGNVTTDVPKRTYIHPESPASGESWMRQTVVFDKMKLTNNEGNSKGHMILHSMHKYQPRIHLIECEGNGARECEAIVLTQCVDTSLDNVITFVFSETQFTTVTAYQNQQITKLKIDKNPFAKGFRDASQQCRTQVKGHNSSHNHECILVRHAPPVVTVGQQIGFPSSAPRFQAMQDFDSSMAQGHALNFLASNPEGHSLEAGNWRF